MPQSLSVVDKMMWNNMKKLFAILIFATALFLLIWQATIYIYRYNQPIEVVDVIKSNKGYYDYLVIKNPPLNGKKFVHWWQEHKEGIKAQYDIPSLSRDGDWVFHIGVWGLGDGFDTDKNGEYKDGYLFEQYEQMCIDELPQEKRCLERENNYAGIGRSDSGLYYIDFFDGGRYIHRGDGQFVESKNSRLSGSMKRLLTIFLLIFVISLLLGRNIYDLYRSKSSRSKK